MSFCIANVKGRTSAQMINYKKLKCTLLTLSWLCNNWVGEVSV